MRKNLSTLRCMLVFMSALVSGIGFAQTEAAPEAPKLDGGGLPTLKKQSGIGSSVAYARSGVLEMGGSLSSSTAENYTETSLSPMVGYFITDNIQISALANMSYVNVEDAEVRSVGSLIAEPSIHVPMTNTTFVFAGIGFGALFQRGEETGFAAAPRIGYKNLVGRSGMLTLSVQPVFGVSENEVQTVQGTVLTVSRAYNLGLGYTVLF